MFSFDRAGLEALDEQLLSKAAAVVPMREIAAGNQHPDVIGMRHDVDDNKDSLKTAAHLAWWEYERNYRSTYYLLHTASYWDDEMVETAHEFESMGHEVGIHVNALAAALRGDGNPETILHAALSTLRTGGLAVTGAVAHGDELCRRAWFVNDEMFAECRRTDYTPQNRQLRWAGRSVDIVPVPLSAFDLAYDANWVPRGRYVSDSGNQWNGPLAEAIETFGDGQLHMNLHPDWWARAFEQVAV